MNQGLLISEIIFAIIYVIAGFVVYELVKSKNGRLRKIMIAYFSSVVFIYVGASLYYLFPDTVSVNTFRIIVSAPKAITMLMLYNHLRTKNPK